MAYKAIFEIGPISHYLQSTRKTRDLWGGSFLFSYLMGYAAKLILEKEIGRFDLTNKADRDRINTVILRPSLVDDPLFHRICQGDDSNKIDAGSIPDQIYCRLNNEKTPQFVIDGIKDKLITIFDSCILKLLDNYQPDLSYEPSPELVKAQIVQYFRLFYVMGDNQFDQQSLNNAVASRGNIFNFNSYRDEINSPEFKHEKCSLCGDRKKVVTLKNARRNNRDEHLCAICTIKRGLLDHFSDIINIERFQSTTFIAAKVPRQVMHDNYNKLKDDLVTFIIAHQKSDEAKDDLNRKQRDRLKSFPISPDVINHFSYQFYFSNESTTVESKDNESSKVDFRDKVKQCADENEKPWIKRAFFAIVALDGDNTGEFMKQCEQQGFLNDFSRTISHYTQKTADIIRSKGGQLIYCGGEDTLAILHPTDILDIVKDLFQEFKNSFEELASKIGKKLEDISISAGAVICHHKHPLSLAIRDAHSMLEDVAKAEPGKASIAIRLIKGGSDRCDFVCKIKHNKYDLGNFENLVGCDIPRGFVYKLLEEKEVLQETLETNQEIVNYLFFLFEKTRAKLLDKEKEKVKIALENLANNFNFKVEKEKEFERLINYLYFARFLEGGE